MVAHSLKAGLRFMGRASLIQFQDGQERLRGHLHLVVAKSAALRFCLAAKTSPAPLLLRFPPKPLAPGFGGNPVLPASSFCLLETLRVFKS